MINSIEQFPILFQRISVILSNLKTDITEKMPYVLPERNSKSLTEET